MKFMGCEFVATEAMPKDQLFIARRVEDEAGKTAFQIVGGAVNIGGQARTEITARVLEDGE